MTKPEAVTQDLVDAITQDICDLDNNPFEGMADDDVWLSVNDLQVILSRHLGEAIQAAEQRGMERERERIEGANTCEMSEVAAWRFVDELRTDYGSVTILPINEEADTIHTQMAIDCLGEWTGWKDRRFFGESIIQCLAKAVCEKNQAIRQGEQA